MRLWLALSWAAGALATTTIPLRRRSPRADPNEHPFIALELHRNRAERIHARVHGLRAPSVDDMRARVALRQRSLPPSALRRRQAIETLARASKPTSPANAQSAGLDIVAYEGEAIGYVVEIQAGTPPRPYSLLVDTGSTDTYLCLDSNMACKLAKQATISTASSSSLVLGAEPWQMEVRRLQTVTLRRPKYGTGWIAGLRATDTLRIGSLILANHSFGVTTYEGTAMQDNLYSGLLGLGIAPAVASSASLLGAPSLASASASAAPVRQTWAATPIQALKAQGLVQKNEVGYVLGRLMADGTTDGAINFGGADPSRVDGRLWTFANATADGFWRAPLTTVTVSSNASSPIEASAIAILDTVQRDSST